MNNFFFQLYIIFFKPRAAAPLHMLQRWCQVDHSSSQHTAAWPGCPALEEGVAGEYLLRAVPAVRCMGRAMVPVCRGLAACTLKSISHWKCYRRLPDNLVSFMLLLERTPLEFEWHLWHPHGMPAWCHFAPLETVLQLRARSALVSVGTRCQMIWWVLCWTLCAGPIHAKGEGNVLLFLTLQTRMFSSSAKGCFEPPVMADGHTTAQGVVGHNFKVMGKRLLFFF